MAACHASDARRTAKARAPGFDSSAEHGWDLRKTYRVDDVARWWEWEAAEGRRRLEWSRGARSPRAFAGLGTDRTDRTDEQGAEDDTLDGDQRLALPSDTWSSLRASNKAPALLDAAEVGGIDGARRWLRDHGLTWSDAPARSDKWPVELNSP